MKRQRLTKGVRFVILDVETAPSDDGDRIIQFGWTTHIPDAGLAPAAEEFLIDPGVSIENTYQHGITDAHIKEHEPPVAAFDIAVERVTDILVGHHGLAYETILVAHFAQFDIGVLRLEYDRLRQELPDLAVLDTHALAHYLAVSKSGYGRKELLRVLSNGAKKVRKDHSAASDADDAAFILDALLIEARKRSWSDLTALRESAAASRPGGEAAPRLRTGDYPEALAERGASALGFRPIYRSPEHTRSHEADRKTPVTTAAEATAWLVRLRECVALRCPQLGDRARTYPHAFPDLFAQLRDDLRAAIAAEDHAEANTLLFAISRAFLPYFYGDTTAKGSTVRPDEVIADFDEMVVLLAAAHRCDFSTPPVDACPGCRRRPSARGCAFDTWPIYWARTYLLRQYKPDRVRTLWLDTGLAGKQIPARPALAGALMEEQIRIEKSVQSRPQDRKGTGGATRPGPVPEDDEQRKAWQASWAAMTNSERKKAASLHTLNLLADLALDVGVPSASACALRAERLALVGRIDEARRDIARSLAALDEVRTPAVTRLVQLDASFAARTSRVRPVAPEPPPDASRMKRRIGHRAPERVSQRRFTLPLPVAEAAGG